jgi:hypothetical protein
MTGIMSFAEFNPSSDEPKPTPTRGVIPRNYYGFSVELVERIRRIGIIADSIKP